MMSLLDYDTGHACLKCDAAWAIMLDIGGYIYLQAYFSSWHTF